MTPQQIIDAWNAQADEANQWGALGEDEKLMWAYKQAIAEAALARQDVQDEIDRGAKTLRETYLAQPEQEPVAVARVDDLERGGRVRALAMGLALDAPLYTSPPASKPLTDEEIMEMYGEVGGATWISDFARAIEAAHGIKGDA